MRLGRPVKWIEDRRRTSSPPPRSAARCTRPRSPSVRTGDPGVKDVFVHDTGAYNPYGLTVPINTPVHAARPLRLPELLQRVSRRLHQQADRDARSGEPADNTGCSSWSAPRPCGPRAGAGPGRDPAAQLPPPDAFPHDHEIIFQDFAPLVYDSGDYEPALDKAIELIGYEPTVRPPARRTAARRGRRATVGLGIVAYVEGTGIGPYEGARVRVEASGKVCLVTGVGTQGQGHFTSFAQIVADQLGVGVTDVRVVTGDTREFHWGTGTFASRGAVVAGNACHAAAVASGRRSFGRRARSWRSRRRI